MSKNWKVFFDYRAGVKTRSKTKNLAGDTNSVELGPWIDKFENKKKISNYRLFYVLKPNAEDVVKFGIAGTKGGEGAWGRLHQYINEYGYSSDLNRCTGIQMLYLAGNKYKKEVEITNSSVYKKELACKKYFRTPDVNAHLLGRGFERINLDRIAELFDIIEDPSNLSFEDTETERRIMLQRGQQTLNEEDYVVKITGHTTKGGKSTAKTKYTCYWNRPFVLTQEKLVKKAKSGKLDSDLRGLERDQARFETEETERLEVFESLPEPYITILNYKGGPEALEIYKKLHPKALFRD
jgi:hypothetical protein|tara:strand:- start:1024 stop:1908 length:885 start_codon:yes stop_codon:yes gene_type:complete